MKTYHGGCHCQKVRYKIDLDLTGIISCNCSLCAKRGWLLSFAPASSFTLLQGQDELTEYRFNEKKIEHLFCATCGVASFGRGKDTEGNDTVSINVRCLNDVDITSLSVINYDGKSR